MIGSASHSWSGHKGKLLNHCRSPAMGRPVFRVHDDPDFGSAKSRAHTLAGKLQRASLKRVFCERDLSSPSALKPLIPGNVCCSRQGNMDSARSGESVEPYLGWS